MTSIARRIYRAILLISVVTMAIMVVTVLVVNEDLEMTMLQIEISEERDIYLRHQTTPEVMVLNTTRLAVAFIPTGVSIPPDMPAIFTGLPTPFSAELERDGETYLVRVEASPSGVFYIAKNITHFEEREVLFEMAVAIIVLCVIALSLVLAALSSRRIVSPLQELANQISGIPVGSKMPRLPLAYQDGELQTIAQTFNRFLDELESFVKREQSLLSLASHELRTPIAVISGALDVLEHRQQLSTDDKATLARVRRASTEMEANVNMLLKMARRESVAETVRPVALVHVVEHVLEDLNVHHDVQARVSVVASPEVVVQADPALVHMLLRNLIQNALQHTTRGIQIRLEPGLIEIVDNGAGLTDEQRAILSGQERIDLGSSPLGGLGLYIVTLLCERMQWRLEVVPSQSNGTLIRLHTAPT